MSAYRCDDDYTPNYPNLRPELDCILECARKVVAAWQSRNDHPYAEHVLEHEIDRLQLDLHCIFGDAMPAPRPRPAAVAATPVAVPPVHARREVGRLALAS